MKKITNKTIEFFTSPRLKSFYWNSGTMLLIAFLNVTQEQLTEMKAPVIVVVAIGLIASQITKAVNNKLGGKRMGFGK